VVKKKVAKKKPAKKKATKKTTTRKKATTKKTSPSKNTANKKASKKKSAASAAAARETEKQAVSNAIRAAASAGGNLMKSGREDPPTREMPPTDEAAADAFPPAERTGRRDEAGPEPRQQGREPAPAEAAAAREAEKKAVSAAILAAANAAGSLIKPNAADQPQAAASGPTTGLEATRESTTPAEAPAQELPAAQSTVTSTRPAEQAESPARLEPAPGATPARAAAPAGAGSRTEQQPPAHQGKPRKPGLFLRSLLIALYLAAAVLYAKILAPDFDFAGLVPEFTEEAPTAAQAPAGLRELPEAQMQVIRDVFAPELGED
jgi:hypothetical protein